MNKLTRLSFATLCLFAVVAHATSITTPTSAIPAKYNSMSVIGVAAWTPWPAVPFGTLRMWNTGTRWNQVETSKGYYKWSKMDSVVGLAMSKGVDVIYTFGGTPRWAAQYPNQSCLYGYGSCSAPLSMQDWSNYVTSVAKRYKGRIKYYELWNEPNDTHYYTGSISSLVTMAQVAYKAIKAVDPNAVVLTPCPTWSSSGSPYSWMDKYFAAGGGSWANGVAYHAYPGTSGPEFIINSVTNMRNTMNKYGQYKGIYITEGGWGQNSYLTDQDKQANFVARYLVLAWAKGVSKVSWYAFDEGKWGTLWDSTYGLHKSGVAHKNLNKWMTGATMKNCSTDSYGTWTCNLTRANGYSAQILWNPSGSKGKSVSSTYKRLRTLSGGLSTFSNAYVNVSPKPILIENFGAF